MIISNDPIHTVKNTKRMAKKILDEYEQYMDRKRYLGWSKKKRKFVLKKFR